MRILMIGPDAKAKGGMATVIANFKQHFNSENHDIRYLTTWKEGSLWTRMKATAMSILQIRLQIRRENIDIVHVHMAQDGSFFRKALLILQAKKECAVVLHIHASQFDVFYKKSHPWIQKYIRYILGKPDKVVVLSEEWARFYNELTEVPVSVIENAVEIPAINKYNPDARNIIMFGRIGERKGSYDVLEVAAAVGQKFPDVRFYLYGDGELEQVSIRLKEMRLENVILGGWVDATNKKAILEKAVLHILPSYHEGLPMAILETMAYGIPNLSTTVGGIPQAIQHTKNGILIEAGNTVKLEAEIIHFLADKTTRSQYSKAAFDTIKMRFSMKQYQQKWEKCYRNIEKSM
ncbi:glycosyltransferase family 4 protein [Listeria newyorkensis]|uniref:Glycosyltransferase family 4 protein n=1 Tax=Listeria newyorkensis TaxID=1497681 RepID=A0A841YW35_9LIST|nr:glycosyltransferase family 4 protein [Listeria newyorkensis]MBC1457172.1 glycosyltransferase family 4 protein [Listeria newyorkensis]